jgi:hypothetical protein
MWLKLLTSDLKFNTNDMGPYHATHLKSADILSLPQLSPFRSFSLSWFDLPY